MSQSPRSGCGWRRRLPRAACLVVAFAAAHFVASCTSSLSDLPTQVGGLPQGAPPRPATPPAYPAVHDMPPPRASAVLTEGEKKKVEAELAALREHQEKRAGAKNPDNQ